MGNPDLEPETMETYEAELLFTPKSNFIIDLSYFYIKIKDLIFADTSSTPSLFENGGTQEIEGIELILRGQYSKDNYWRLAYTYQEPRDGETDRLLPDVPLHRAYGSFNYGLTRHLNIHTDILWTGPRTRQEGDSRDDTPAYTTVDLALTAKKFKHPVEIQAVIHNLFDEDYVDPDRSGASRYLPDDIPREGISGSVNVTYKF